MKRIVFIIVSIIITALMVMVIAVRSGAFRGESYFVELKRDSLFSLKRGDILVRANWPWLPGSCEVDGGKNYGHVAIVTDGYTGSDITEVLEKSTVIEALFFDQVTRKLQFKRDAQIRETKAIISFGKRFEGRRYRLRAQLDSAVIDSMILFLRNQLDFGYSVFSSKVRFENDNEKRALIKGDKNVRWNCATLTWEAFFITAGMDIDSNGGSVIYPSDIIPANHFNAPSGRIRF